MSYDLHGAPRPDQRCNPSARHTESLDRCRREKTCFTGRGLEVGSQLSMSSSLLPRNRPCMTQQHRGRRLPIWMEDQHAVELLQGYRGNGRA